MSNVIDSNPNTPLEDDILDAAMNTPLATEPLWVTRWGKWVTVIEMPSDVRADLLDDCTKKIKVPGSNKTKSEVNTKKLYPYLAIMSVLNPISTDLPDKSDPNYNKYPGATGDDGSYLTPPHPKAGVASFNVKEHLLRLSKKSSAALEQISQVASRLSALRPEDIDEKKDNSDQENSESEQSTLD